MDRARRAAFTALIVVVMLAAAAGSRGSGVLAGVVAWPTSTLVISEVQTGGTSASDEFAEIANQGAAGVDLLGLEVIYATSSGSTVTRKTTWTTSTILDPGRRFLLGNASGVFGPISDATYSGGFAATGGAIAIRVVGGATVDAVGWGDAINAFVEGTAAVAPPAGSSLERGPGGAAGNVTDTNDNAIDWFVQAAPSPQGLNAPPVPAVGSPSPGPTATPTPIVTASPTSTPSATPTASPTVVPTPSATSTATPTPTQTPTPTPTPSPSPNATPTPTPTPSPILIGDARALPDDTVATIEGVLTTPLGALESGRAGFIQDESGGIALYLDATVSGTWPAGMSVTVEGSVGNRFSQRTLRISESALEAGPVVGLPDPLEITTGSATEFFEGVRVIVSGTVLGSPDQLTDGLGVTLDDGSGPVRAVIGPDAVGGLSIASGMVATVSGPLGQRDSSGTGTAGYRIQATLPGGLEIAPLPTPTPTPAGTPTPTPTATTTPTPTATPTATPTPAPTPTPRPTATTTPTPTPTPTPTATTLTLAEVRATPIGTKVRTTGVVVAEAGRLGSPTLLAIVDPTGGVVVHLPASAATYARGALLEVSGDLAAPYGQLEVRPARSDIRNLGTGALPTPQPIGSGGLDESTEGRLVTAKGRLTGKPTRSVTGVLSMVLERDGAAPLKVMAAPSSRITTASLKVGSIFRVVGFVGQRATRSGALDGYRIWARDPSDLVITAGPSGTPSPTPAPGSPRPSAGSESPATVSIGKALKITDRPVAIDAIVTAPATLLDSTGRRIVVQDGSGAVEVLLPADTAAPPVGARVHAIGRMGVAYDAPRLRADQLAIAGSGPMPPALVLHGQPGVAHEWRLVTVTGRIDTIHKLGDRWRAELIVGAQKVVVVGEAGAGIPSSALVGGRTATVIGIARRPFPSATDRRFAVTPRFPADVRVDGQPVASGNDGGGASGQGARSGGPAGSAGPPGAAPANADLVDLDGLVGSTVRVGGLVVDLRADGFTLDDGTATGRVVLRGSAMDVLPLIEPDDALEATGRVEASPDGAVVVVDDPAGIVQASDPAAADPSSSLAVDPAVGGATASSPAPAAGRLAGLGSGPFPFDAGAAGLGTLLAISAASLAITVLRREQIRRRTAARIAGRLATFAGPSAAPPEPRSAERASSTIHSA
jgi:hypothetical protein